MKSPRRIAPLLRRIRAGCLIGAMTLLTSVSFASERDAVHLSAIPEFAAEDWAALPRLHPTIVSIFEAEENVAGYNMHPALTRFGGKYWAMWSSGAWGEDMPGQKVRFASSVDGIRWSGSTVLAEPDPGYMLTPTGFWVRNGELLAMACHRLGKPVVDGKRQKPVGTPDHTLRIFRYDPARRAWDRVGSMPDTFNDKPVERLSTGEWAMIRNTHSDSRFFAIGGTTAIDAWEFFPIPPPLDNHKMTEAHVYELPDGAFSLLFRDNSRSHFLYRAFSEDRGRTWTHPVQTDFRDQTAKFSVLRLSTGRYLMASNPRQAEERFPLTVSLSDDGLVFDRASVAVDSGPDPKYPNFTKRKGAQYPQALEAEGHVWIIYSLNQESIEVVRIPLDRL